ncbi:hypothetical protein RUM43_011848 [Polyplax serrata]|uniref:Uncharacterized protein n=1 Tax=Polyplax serrata TaxID=468196 RepID=A0AAN8P1N1_POLSC
MAEQLFSIEVSSHLRNPPSRKVFEKKAESERNTRDQVISIKNPWMIKLLLPADTKGFDLNNRSSSRGIEI